MFNATVLPVAINDASANVKTSGGRRVKFHKSFVDRSGSRRSGVGDRLVAG
jgi:hypothetical protein